MKVLKILRVRRTGQMSVHCWHGSINCTQAADLLDIHFKFALNKLVPIFGNHKHV